jgi:undecaprenyl-diphosphatase
VIFAKPAFAAAFLTLNGLILLAGERYRTRASLAADAAIAAAAAPGATAPAAATAQLAEAAQQTELVAAGNPPPGRHSARVLAPGSTAPAGPPAHAGQSLAVQADTRLAGMSMARAVTIGSAQILALLAGISRDGVTMVAGMRRGLSREDAARFAFLLATPVILAAGALKVPDLAGPLGYGIRGQIIFGSVLSGIGAYLAVRFLLRYLRTRTLTPFGIYCVIAGVACLAYLGLK